MITPVSTSLQLQVSTRTKEAEKRQGSLLGSRKVSCLDLEKLVTSTDRNFSRSGQIPSKVHSGWTQERNTSTWWQREVMQSALWEQTGNFFNVVWRGICFGHDVLAWDQGLIFSYLNKRKYFLYAFLQPCLIMSGKGRWAVPEHKPFAKIFRESIFYFFLDHRNLCFVPNLQHTLLPA